MDAYLTLFAFIQSPEYWKANFKITKESNCTSWCSLLKRNRIKLVVFITLGPTLGRDSQSRQKYEVGNHYITLT